MVCFQTKNPNLSKFWKALPILEKMDIFYGHLVHFVLIWYIFPVLVSWTKKNLATPSASARVSLTRKKFNFVYSPDGHFGARAFNIKYFAS
jgi:uncharacterized membrane protein (DUF485 family)